MRPLALTVATAAVVAFAFPQISRVQAQGADSKSSASARQPSAGQARGLDGASTRGSDGRGSSVVERSESPGRSAGESERSQSSVGARAKSRETTIHGRSQTRIGVSSGSSEDIVVKRKRYGVVAFNDEPRRRGVIKRRQPGVAITTE